MILGTTTLDFSSDSGVSTALECAKLRDEELTLLHCVKPPPFPHSQRESDLRPELDQAQRLLEEQFGRLKLKTPPKASILVGHPGRTITTLAQELGASLVVLGPHRPKGVLDGLLGGTTDHVFRTSRVPCLRATHRVSSPPRKIMFGTDFSEAARVGLISLLEWLRGFPHPSGRRSSVVEVVNVQAFASGLGGQVRNLDYNRYFRELLDGLPHQEGVKIRSKVLGAPTVFEGLDRAAEDFLPDLVALGTHGHGPFVRLLIGSVALHCSQRLNYPVMLFPPVASDSGRS